MFDLNGMKKIYDDYVGKEVWVIADRRKINRNGQIYSKKNELTVYPATIYDIRIGEYGFVDGKPYATAEANVCLECMLEQDGKTKRYLVNGGHFLLNVTCFATEEEARNELALMLARTKHEQLSLEAKQMETKV